MILIRSKTIYNNKLLAILQISFQTDKHSITLTVTIYKNSHRCSYELHYVNEAKLGTEFCQELFYKKEKI